MKVSVITVCRNSEKTIGYTIESFLRQNYPDKEMIVVDGLSTDRTLEIVRSFSSDLIRVASESDRGIYDAMNKGLRRYSGDAVGFLHSDDTYHDEAALSAIAAGLDGFDIVYGDLNMVRDHRLKQTVRVWAPGHYSRQAFRFGWAAPHPTLYARRRVFDAVGEFNTKYRIAADYDFMLQALALRRFSSKYLKKSLIDFQLGGTSTNGWRAFVEGNLECLNVRRRHLGSGPVDIALFGRPLRRIAQMGRIIRPRRV